MRGMIDRRVAAERILAVLTAACLPGSVRAQVSEGLALSGVKTALERGANLAVAALGRSDGFLGNPKVKIPLPGVLADAAKVLKAFGQQKRMDDLVTAMNRAAEAAVPQAKALLVDAVKSMSVADAHALVTGPDDSVTRFFAEKTRGPLAERFLPIVARHTEKLAVADKYNALASKASGLGLLDKREANIQEYVTDKALDGLYLMIAEEERKIRRDPVGTGSAILKQVFGGLK